jgi:hypothetical protein
MSLALVTMSLALLPAPGQGNCGQCRQRRRRKRSTRCATHRKVRCRCWYHCEPWSHHTHLPNKVYVNSRLNQFCLFPRLFNAFFYLPTIEANHAGPALDIQAKYILPWLAFSSCGCTVCLFFCHARHSQPHEIGACNTCACQCVFITVCKK